MGELNVRARFWEIYGNTWEHCSVDQTGNTLRESEMGFPCCLFLPSCFFSDEDHGVMQMMRWLKEPKNK